MPARRARPRLRSLRARLLLAMAAIAVAAVGATAWLTSIGTADRLRDDMRQGLEVDAYIYDGLYAYATSHPDWRGVEGLVRDLATRTGRRIALTTLQGQVIVDSARLDGGGQARLPRRAAAVVDPFNPVITFTGFPERVVDEGLPAEVAPDLYTLTPEEAAERLAIAEEGSACLGDAGVPNVVEVDEYGMPNIEFDDTDDSSIEAFERCVDVDALYAPAGDEAAAQEQIERDLQACLRDRGVEFTLVPQETGEVFAEVDWLDEAATLAYEDCGAAAERNAYDSLWADPARLYLGTRDSTLPLLDAGRGRTVLAAGGVALVAVAITVLVSRRLLRPVAALTTAAHRLAGGELAQRVEVRGEDEVARLARSFNTMADALAANEEQRRRMVNDIAHELRTPLANIRGYVEAALDGVTPSDDELLSSLHEEAMLLQRLVGDLQTLALAEAGQLVLHREQVDLAEVADQVVSAHRRQAGDKGIELAVERPDAGEAAGSGGGAGRPDSADSAEEPVVVDADAARLRQALGNLVSNALRYSAAGDRVTVRVGGHGGLAVVEVADTGIGIAPEDLPHVFDRFWRADMSRARHTGGSGLGLAICSQLVEAHGGRVTATSTPGEGSVFSIRLPRLAVPAGHAPSPPRA